MKPATLHNMSILSQSTIPTPIPIETSLRNGSPTFHMSPRHAILYTYTIRVISRNKKATNIIIILSYIVYRISYFVFRIPYTVFRPLMWTIYGHDMCMLRATHSTNYSFLARLKVAAEMYGRSTEGPTTTKRPTLWIGWPHVIILIGTQGYSG